MHMCKMLDKDIFETPEVDLTKLAQVMSLGSALKSLSGSDQSI